MIMTLRNYFFAACALVALSCGRTLKDGDFTLTVLSTNDVHGAWFDSSYVDGRTKPSLMAVKYYVDSVRTANGRRMSSSSTRVTACRATMPRITSIMLIRRRPTCSRA